jgi:glycosyltransferase involved in cell wall biosynthesis
MNRDKLSIIVPVYNEEKTVGTVLERILKVDWKRKVEVIVVDDGSTDKTGSIIEKWKRKKLAGWKFIDGLKNQGKGAAIGKALKITTGEWVGIQDADLEYNPAQIKKLVDVAEAGDMPVVYGTRNWGIRNEYRYAHFYWGAKALYLLANLAFGQRLTDPETCQKVIKKEILDFAIEEKGFGVEIELMAKISKKGIKIWEVPIPYRPRGFEEGKKIKWQDGVRALWLVAKYTL